MGIVPHEGNELYTLLAACVFEMAKGEAAEVISQKEMAAKISRA